MMIKYVFPIETDPTLNPNDININRLKTTLKHQFKVDKVATQLVNISMNPNRLLLVVTFKHPVKQKTIYATMEDFFIYHVDYQLSTERKTNFHLADIAEMISIRFKAKSKA